MDNKFRYVVEIAGGLFPSFKKEAGFVSPGDAARYAQKACSHGDTIGVNAKIFDFEKKKYIVWENYLND